MISVQSDGAMLLPCAKTTCPATRPSLSSQNSERSPRSRRRTLLKKRSRLARTLSSGTRYLHIGWCIFASTRTSTTASRCSGCSRVECKVGGMAWLSTRAARRDHGLGGFIGRLGARAVRRTSIKTAILGFLLFTYTSRQSPQSIANFANLDGQSIIHQLFNGPAPRSPLCRLFVRLRRSRSNTCTK